VKRAKPDAGTLLEIHLNELKIPFVREWKFCSTRKWRADFMLSPLGSLEPILVEIEGGVWNNGAHVRGKHFLSDMEKYNTAAALGYTLFRFTPEQILKGEAKAWIQEHLL
jgi:hypothetical protein